MILWQNFETFSEKRDSLKNHKQIFIEVEEIVLQDEVFF